MSVNIYNKDNDSLSPIAGGTLYADNPIGSIIPYGGATAPSGWLLCQGQEVSRTEYAELFAVIGTAFGTGDGSTTFNVPDLREATTKGTGLSAKSPYHYDNAGIKVGQYIGDRLMYHDHNVYVRDTGHSHSMNYVSGQFAPGAYGFVLPYSSTPGDHSTNSGNASIQVNSTSNFTGTANTTSTAGTGSTTEVKAVGVNYIIKAKQVAVPADFRNAIDDALSEFAKPITLQPLNNSTISYDKSRIVGGIVTVCADIIVQSGSYLTKENAIANVPNLGTASIGYILPCLYRNTGNGAEEPSFAIIQTAGNLYPYYTKTEYNQIRINASYSSKI